MHILSEISSFDANMNAGATSQHLSGRWPPVGRMPLFILELLPVPVEPDLHIRIRVEECLGERAVREGVHGDINGGMRLFDLGDIETF